MSKTFPNLLDGPTYITVRACTDGSGYVDETKLNASLQDAIDDIDGLVQVVMIEGFGDSGKAIDITTEAAELWWAKHGHIVCETAFDVPAFIHDNLSWVYSEIAVSQYNAGCWHDQQVSCNPRVL